MRWNIRRFFFLSHRKFILYDYRKFKNYGMSYFIKSVQFVLCSLAKNEILLSLEFIYFIQSIISYIFIHIPSFPSLFLKQVFHIFM